MKDSTANSLATAILAALLGACGSDGDDGSGSLVVTASGEEAALHGYPVGSGDDEIAFADGWSLSFHHVLLSIADFSLRAADGQRAGLDAETVVVDLARGEPELWSFEQVAARRWDRVGFRYAPPSEDARAVDEVDDQLLARMVEDGLSLLISATADKDDRQIELEFGFDFEVEMSRCVSGYDETDGVVVPGGGVAEAQITVHLDHLFFDSYAVEEAALRFDAMAAMTPDADVLTLDDLAAQDNLSDLLDEHGDPLELGYDPGSTFEPVPANLREYVFAAATTTGHFNGEGHCDYARLD